jgi:drug/metabolite transporter (DMT)-like permease
MSTRIKGYLLAAVAAATYGTNPIFAIPLYRDGMDALSVLFFRYLTAVVIVALMMKARGDSFGLSRHEVIPVTAIGIIVGISSLALFASYNYMGGGIASTLLFIYPILVAILMAVLYHERAGWLTLLCISMAVGGIALLYRNSNGDTLSLPGVLLVMLSAVSYSIYLIYVNHSTLRTIPTLKLTFYILLSGVALYAVCSRGCTTLTLPRHCYMWLNIAGIAILPTVLSFICTTAAVLLIGSTPTAILGALEPLTAVILGVAVLGEPMTLRMALGMSLIIAAVCLIVGRGGK